MSEEDAELMGRYCDGDASAFRELYEKVAPKILGYLVRMAGDRELAEDVLQQTFLKVHRARSAYVRGANPLPWIYAIARRTFLDEARKRARSKESTPRSTETAPEPVASLAGAELHAEQNPSPALLSAVFAELQKLPPAQREAVVLTKLDGKSVAEAAAIVGATPGALKVRAHRGYAALRKALGTALEDDR